MSLIAGFTPIGAAAQQPPPQPPQLPPAKSRTEPPPVKKIGENLLQLGNIVVDTQKKEVSVPGQFLSDRTLEFIAASKNGGKSYESAIELDTDAVSFNFALILIGLEKSHAVVPTRHFDPVQAAGDPVEIFVEWGSGDAVRKVRVEELLYDTSGNRVPQMGTWVYTGSTIDPGGNYRAEMDGTLIGFVHDPASIIENSTGGGLNAYGSIRLNPNLKLSPGTALKLTVKAIPKRNQN